MTNLFVSVVIPIRNEERFIKNTLERIAKQSYPKDKMEILVIDGMSNDRTREIIKNFILKNKWLDLRIIDNLNKQRASAVNIGITEAKGDVIMRIDARSIIPPDYIEKCIATLINTEADNVGGIQKPRSNLFDNTQWRKRAPRDDHKTSNFKSPTLTQEAIGIALSNPFGVGNAQFRLGKKSGYVDSVYLGCFRREVFRKVGLFDEESSVISEDSDMNQRIRDAEGKVYLNKDIVAYYIPRENLRDLWRLYFRYGGARAGFLIKHKKLTSLRQFIPPFFLLSIILLLLTGIFINLIIYLWFSVIGIYILSVLSISFNSTFSHRIKISGYSKLSLFWRLVFTFPIMHFSWALGFWLRLLQRPRPGEYWGY